jgi:hypothetical protein
LISWCSTTSETQFRMANLVDFHCYPTTKGVLWGGGKWNLHSDASQIIFAGDLYQKPNQRLIHIQF